MFFVTSLLTSCKKDVLNTDPATKLRFSSESVKFDTVFTTIGSVTKQLKIYNPTPQKLIIKSIQLGGGNNSLFSININGSATFSKNNIELAPKDSMFIFVKVTVNPNNSATPFFVNDSIEFLTNNNYQKVKLEAYGQNAHYIIADSTIQGWPKFKLVAKKTKNVTWTNDKPYVIYGYAAVDSATLFIKEGVRIYCAKNSGLWIWPSGCLKVKGTKESPVTFQGSRLESYYKDTPGQWDRIWINEGYSTNEIEYAVIKNAFIGIQAETIYKFTGNYTQISNTIIKNCTGSGIWAKTSAIVAGNVEVSNCGQYCIVLSRGGIYDFRNCTVGNYWTQTTRQTPSIVLNNYYVDDNKQLNIYDLVDAYFGNCILYGSIEEEISLDYNYQGKFNYKFDYCLLKTKTSSNDTKHYNNCIFNSDPLFVDYSKNNYQLQSGSPAVNKGNYTIIDSAYTKYNFDIKKDFNGELRNNDNGKTDIGAYKSK